MPKTKQEKQSEVASLVERFSLMQSAVIAAFAKIKVKDERVLRNEMKNLGASYQVVKKTMLKRALSDLKLAGDFLDDLKGTLVLAIGTRDPVAAVKALAKFAKGKEAFSLHGGFLQEHGAIRALTKGEVLALSQIQSREELLSRVVGSLQSPLAGMVNVMAGNLRNFVQVLNAYSKVKA